MGGIIGSYRSIAVRPEESATESTSTECFLQPDGSAEGTAADDTEEEQELDLKQAIKDGDLEAVKEIIESRADVNQRYDAGLTPLHFAVLHGHVGITRALVQAGGNVFAATTDDYKMTPMDLANAESNRPLFDALVEEPPTACASRQRFAGPAIIVGVVLANLCVFGQVTSAFHSFDTLPLVLVVLASVCILNLLLVNSLDPGAVEHEDVAFVQELRNLPEDQLLVHPPDSVATDESFSVLQKDSDSGTDPEVYRWCRSCNLWRLPNVSHCSACGRCFWRMDHHCFAIGNCVAARNHRFFVLMLLSGSAAWAISIVYLTKTVESGEWQDAGIVKQVISIVYIVVGCLAMLVGLPFTCFHTAVLVLNVNTRMLLRPKKALKDDGDGAAAPPRRRRLLNSRAELRQLFCMPLRFRSGVHGAAREPTSGGFEGHAEPG